jgi:DNA-binding NtrC family response regulator
MNEINILIVDDDHILGETLSDVVEIKGGYSTERAGTAREALRKAREKFFHVALLDLTLPDMEGTDLLRQLKQLHAAMQVIVLTGQTSLEKAEETVRQGAFAYLIKPSSSEEIMGAIQRALAK